MFEVWLRPNRRALLFGMLVPGLLMVASGWLMAVALLGSFWIGWTVIGSLGLVLGLLLAAQLLFWMRLPRLAYDGEHLLVYLEGSSPTRVPVEIVECFFLGQGASELPKLKGRDAETANVVVRLAESAQEWRHRDVRPSLGHWCEGYITISGAWCEPIDGEALKALNQRLIQAHRAQKQRLAARVAEESA